MKLLQINSGPFHRFGSRYARLFDTGHLLGRGAFDDTWLVKNHNNDDEKREPKKVIPIQKIDNKVRKTRP